MTDKDILYDILISEKFIIDICSKNTQECIDNKIKDNFISILDDEYRMHTEILDELKKRNWYNANYVNNEYVQLIKDKYKNNNL